MISIVVSRGTQSYTLTNMSGRNLIKKNSLKIHESEYGEMYKPTVNSAEFTVFFEGTVASFLTLENVSVVISDNQTPIFTGFIRPLTEFRFSGMGRTDAIAVKGLGVLSRLEATYKGSTYLWGNAPGQGPKLSVCDPDHPLDSAVHILLGMMAWTGSIVTPVIPMEVPLLLISTGDVLQDRFTNILFDSGHYCTETPDGRLSIRPFIVPDPVAIKTYSDENANIIRALSVSKKENKEKSVIVGYRRENHAKFTIYSAEINHTLAVRSWFVIPTRNQPFVWPFEQDSEGLPVTLQIWAQNDMSPWDARYGRFRKKFSDDGTMLDTEDIFIPFPDPDLSGLDAGCWHYRYPVANILFRFVEGTRPADIITAQVTDDGGITYTNKGSFISSAHPIYGCVTASWEAFGINVKIGPISLANYHTSYDAMFVEVMGITITGVLEYFFNNMKADNDEDAPRIYAGPHAEAELCKQVIANTILQKADAEALGKTLFNQLRAGIAKFPTIDPAAPGDIVRIIHPEKGIDSVSRIITRDYSPGENSIVVYDLTAEGLTPFEIESQYVPVLLPHLGRLPATATQSLAATLSMLKELANRPTYDEVASDKSTIFYDQPIGPYTRGDLWIRDEMLYVSTLDRAADLFVETDWILCIRANITSIIQSTNGDKFRPGQSISTTLIARCFRNGVEITDSLGDSAFRWVRTSMIPQSAPDDDATWNLNHATGYRSVVVTTDSIFARAVFTLEIIE